MTWLLAANAILAALPQGQEAWTKQVFAQVSPSVARIPGAGYAGLIDDRGYFIAHASVIRGETATAFLKGQELSLSRIYVDEPSQLCLLAAKSWQAGGSVLRMAKTPTTGRVIAVTEAGPVLADLADLNKAGIMRPSNRYLPLSEIRLETQSNRLAGSLLFSARGELVGMLGATLDQGVAMSSAMNLASPGSGAKTFGPAGMTVTYSVSPQVLSRVIRGFVSESHRPEHPSLGIQFKDVNGTAVTVVSVGAGSTAEEGGMQVGDVVVTFGTEPIRSSFRFASKLFESTPGDVITLKVRRGSEVKELKLRVGILK